MDEEKKQVLEEDQEGTEANSDVGDKPEENPIVVGANAAAERLGKENERLERNIKELKDLQAYNKLGGNTEGAPEKKEPVEETNSDYANNALKGKITPKE